LAAHNHYFLESARDEHTATEPQRAVIFTALARRSWHHRTLSQQPALHPMSAASIIMHHTYKHKCMRVFTYIRMKWRMSTLLYRKCCHQKLRRTYLSCGHQASSLTGSMAFSVNRCRLYRNEQISVGICSGSTLG